MCDVKVSHLAKLKVYIGKQLVGTFAVLTANIELVLVRFSIYFFTDTQLGEKLMN